MNIAADAGRVSGRNFAPRGNRAGQLRQPTPIAPAPRTAQPTGYARQVAAEHADAYKRSGFRFLPTLLSYSLIAAILVIGWRNRNEGYITAEEGIGYWLGIVGGIAMLLLLIYPLRKRLRTLRRLGSVASWFRLHMALGVLGPVLILYHSSFRLGSLNSNIALISMLTVAVSGLIGRYIYAKLHRGLYGEQIRLKETIDDAALFKNMLGTDLVDTRQIMQRMQRYETKAFRPTSGFWGSLWTLLTTRYETKTCHGRLRREIKRSLVSGAAQFGWNRKDVRQRSRSADNYLRCYFAAINRVVTYRFFQKLFSLWHILHMPLFLFLILASSIHVVAVHLY